MSAAIERVMVALDERGRKVRRSGGTWMAQCPAHDDREPSLHISPGRDGRALLHCHAGCSTTNVVTALGLNMAALFDGVVDYRTGRAGGDFMRSFLFEWRRKINSADGPECATTRHVALALSMHANAAGGSCFPSIRLLVEETRLSNKTIIEHLRQLEMHGWIQRFRRRSMTGRGWKRYEYLLDFPSAGVVKLLHHHDNETTGGNVVDLLNHDLRGGEPASTDVVNLLHTRTLEEDDQREEKRMQDHKEEKKMGGRCISCKGGLTKGYLDFCFSCGGKKAEAAA